MECKDNVSCGQEYVLENLNVNKKIESNKDNEKPRLNNNEKNVNVSDTDVMKVNVDDGVYERIRKSTRQRKKPKNLSDYELY